MEIQRKVLSSSTCLGMRLSSWARKNFPPVVAFYTQLPPLLDLTPTPSPSLVRRPSDSTVILAETDHLFGAPKLEKPDRAMVTLLDIFQAGAELLESERPKASLVGLSCLLNLRFSESYY